MIFDIKRMTFRNELVFSLDLAEEILDIGSPDSLEIVVSMALGRVQSGGACIDWEALAAMPSRRFGAPETYPVPGSFVFPFAPSRETLQELDDFILDVLAPCFPAMERKPYRPFAVAMLLRFVIADARGFLPVAVVTHTVER